MYALGHHNNVYQGYTRYNEHSKYMERSQQFIPWVIITMCIQDTQGIMNTLSIPWVILPMCIQDTQGIMNTVSIWIGHSNLNPGSS